MLAANSFADTDALLAHADQHEWVAAVTGWVPLLDPPAAEDFSTATAPTARSPACATWCTTSPTPTG